MFSLKCFKRIFLYVKKIWKTWDKITNLKKKLTIPNRKKTI